MHIEFSFSVILHPSCRPALAVSTFKDDFAVGGDVMQTSALELSMVLLAIVTPYILVGVEGFLVPIQHAAIVVIVRTAFSQDA
jgi:hypothetical protein